MPNKVHVIEQMTKPVLTQELEFESADLYASFGIRVATASYIGGFVSGFLMKAIGLALA